MRLSRRLISLPTGRRTPLTNRPADTLPRVVHADREFLVVCKPHGMASAALRAGETGTLVAWVSEHYPEVASVRGRKAVEGGLLHRLDTATAGLLVFARSQAAWSAAHDAAEQGGFRKRYRAHCTPAQRTARDAWPFLGAGPALAAGTDIVSAFRAWGPGRRRVAPLEQGEPCYRTRVLGISAPDAPGPAQPGAAQTATTEADIAYPDTVYPLEIEVELARGFRHQVRAHLAWCGYPITGDSLYDGTPVARAGSARPAGPQSPAPGAPATDAPAPGAPPQRIGLVACAVELRLPDRSLSVQLPEC